MIPYFEFKEIAVGPVTLQVWGLFVALGILAAAAASAALARRRGQKPEIIWDMTALVIASAFLFARLFVVFFYESSYYLADPIEIFKIWQGGWSIMGGFFGGTFAALWYLRRKRVDVLAYADTTIFGIPLGLAIGRIGCFLIHDHPGTATNFFLGVQYPDGIIRHDHGLYLSLNGLILFLVFLFLLKRKVKTGTFLVVGVIWYGLVRFGLDFLRLDEGTLAEARYFFLTPAQYGCLALVLVGILLIRKIRVTPLT